MSLSPKVIDGRKITKTKWKGVNYIYICARTLGGKVIGMQDIYVLSNVIGSYQLRP
jgi:hypothetical protein